MKFAAMKLFSTSDLIMKNSYRSIVSFLVAISTIATVASVASAQNTTNATPPQSSAQPITFSDSIQRSFNIEPVVHRFRGRRGEIIPFSFEITSTGKPLNLSVTLVSLRQEESGIITHAINDIPPQHIRFTSETSFSLTPGQSRTLTGEITVPLAKTNYLSYGVLVRDQGDINELTNQTNPNDATTRASVKFVTQYLLRVDLETRGVDLGELDAMKFQQGKVASVNGMPVAEVFLENPTDLALECFVRAEIENAQVSRAKPFSLGLASRASLHGDERFLVRLMPKSRVRLFAPVSEMLLPGRQNLKVSLLFEHRKLIEEAFEFSVSPGQFPALETKTAHLANLLAAEPAQIELGQTRGARRTVALKLMNNADVEQTLVLEPRDLTGKPLDKLKLSNETLTLAPGRYKNVRVTLEGSGDQSAFGTIIVLSQNGSEVSQAGQLPVALLFTEPPLPQIDISPMQATTQDDITGFRVTVSNQGLGYVPIDAELRITALAGGGLSLADGYGRWLAPGETRELKFMPEKRLPDGEYQLNLVVRTTPEAPATSTTLELALPLAQTGA